MDLKAKMDTLMSEIDCAINFFQIKHKKTKRKAYAIKISSVCFSVLITVVLGLSINEDLGDLVKNIALVLGAIVTIINAVDAFYNYGALWIKNTVTLSKLRELRRKIEFYSAGCDPADFSEKKLNEFLHELQKISKDDIKEWLRIRENVSRTEDKKDEFISSDIKPVTSKLADKFRIVEEKSIEE